MGEMLELRPRKSVLLFVPLLICCAPGIEQGEKTLEFSADLPDLEMPVELEADLADSGTSFARTSSGERVVLQEVPRMLGSEGTGADSVYGTIVGADDIDPAGAPFSFEDMKGGRLMLREQDSPVLVYNFGDQLAEGVPEDRARSSYLHPIYGLFGESLTDDFPEDHYHHRGLSWMWPQVTIEEQQHDLWHIKGVKQEFRSWLAKETGPLCATLGVKNVWSTSSETVVDEWVWIRVFRASELGRAIDISLTWKALESVSWSGAEERGYGGLCFRLAPRSGPIITNHEGRLAEDSDLEPSPWAHQSGVFQGAARSGVAIFQHQSNVDYPAGWCLRHYGFLGVSWPGLERFTLNQGESLTLRFRLWIHRGDVHEGRVADAFSIFSRMSEVRLKNP